MFFVLKLSKQCNLRCTYCYEYDELGVADRMRIEDLERFFAWLTAQQPIGGWPPMHFVFHGGEPLILPHAYLKAIVAAQQRHLQSAGIRYFNSLQTNLTRLDDSTIALLDSLRISLGVSLDVFGEQRVMVSGRDSQSRVLENLQKLFDKDLVHRLGVGIISVLHRRNVDQVVGVYEFCRILGLSYRVLPIFSLTESMPRVESLSLKHDEVVAALQHLGTHWLATGATIDIFPLHNYLDAAIHDLLGLPAHRYDPTTGDWAYIVNTSGDVYSHADAYSDAGWMGNIFEQPFLEILHSPAHAKTLASRLQRAAVCEVCRMGSVCSRIPLIEALPSERTFAEDGSPRCGIALPMIDFFRQHLLADRDTATLIAANRMAR